MTPQPQQELMEIIEKLGGVLKTAQIENTPDWMDYVFMEVIPEAEKKLAAICSRPNTPSPSAPIRSMREDEDGHVSWQQMNEKALAEHDAATRNTTLKKFVKRVRQEFTQHDDEEWYLSAYDFENCIDEFKNSDGEENEQ